MDPWSSPFDVTTKGILLNTIPTLIVIGVTEETDAPKYLLIILLQFFKGTRSEKCSTEVALFMPRVMLSLEIALTFFLWLELGGR